MDNMKKTGLKGYVYDFSVDYDPIVVSNIDGKEWNSIKCLGWLKRVFFTGLAILSTLTSINLLSCFSVNNQECR